MYANNYYYAGDTVVSCSHVRHIVEILAPHAAKWRLIGSQLGFTEGELDNIQIKVLQYNCTIHCLNVMLDEWRQWPVRSHATTPTLEELERVLRTNTVRLGAVSIELRTRLEQARALMDKPQPTHHVRGML